MIKISQNYPKKLNQQFDLNLSLSNIILINVIQNMLKLYLFYYFLMNTLKISNFTQNKYVEIFLFYNKLNLKI